MMGTYTHILLKQEKKVVIPGWGYDIYWFSLDKEKDQEMNSGTTHYPPSFHLLFSLFVGCCPQLGFAPAL